MMIKSILIERSPSITWFLLDLILASSSGQGKQFIIIKDTPDIEYLDYNQRQQTLVKKRKIKKRCILGQVQENTVEEHILDLKKNKLSDLLKAGIVFNQSTLNKVKREENDIKRMERRIMELEEYIESKKYDMIDFNL